MPITHLKNTHILRHLKSREVGEEIFFRENCFEYHSLKCKVKGNSPFMPRQKRGLFGVPFREPPGSPEVSDVTTCCLPGKSKAEKAILLPDGSVRKEYAYFVVLGHAFSSTRLGTRSNA